jgi:hypothetical protein
MFDVMELRLIRYSVIRTIENLKDRLKILDRESDEAVEAMNDLVLYKAILEKIKDRTDV